MTQGVMNLTRVSIDMYQVSKHSSALYCITALAVFFFPLCLSLSRCASRRIYDRNELPHHCVSRRARYPLAKDSRRLKAERSSLSKNKQPTEKGGSGGDGLCKALFAKTTP